MIRGTDGLDYQDLTERLLGNPADTPRNAWVVHLRKLQQDPGTLQAVIDLPFDASVDGCIKAVNRHRAQAHLRAHAIAGKRASTLIVDELGFPTQPT